MAKKQEDRFITLDNGEVAKATFPIVVSASRSTDIPAFYADWFFHRLKKGYSAWTNPFNGVKSYVGYMDTKFIVFWSKNPRPLLKHLDVFKNRGIGCYIQYTLNDYEEEGLEQLCAELRLLDPEYYRIVDLKNPKRVIHALEICYMTGRTYTSFRTQQKKERPFRIIKIGLTRDREELYDRINRRVDMMMEEGLLEEVRSVLPYRHLNSLNTVGYKELFKYLDGEWELSFAIEKIKQNSRIYSRKQMTWFKRDEEIRWFHPEQEAEIFAYLRQSLS